MPTVANMNNPKDSPTIAKLSAALVEKLNAPQLVLPTKKISKSKFVAGVQCLKRLYLQVHLPHLAIVSDEAKAVMEQGTEIGILARRAFPGGVLVESDPDHLAAAIRETQELLKNPTVRAIFEATFEYDGVLVRVDVLDRSRSGFRIVEVKSSTAVKPHYAYDIGIQKHVLLGAGVRLNGTFLMHLSRDYVFDGKVEAGANKYDLSCLFNIPEIEPINRGQTTTMLNEQFRVLSQIDPPDVQTGRHCHEPVKCEFFNHCHAALPKDHVARLPIRREKVDWLVSRGITRINQVSDCFVNFSLSLTERTRLRAVKSEKAWVDRQQLARELATLRYPLCFADFETIFPALPWYEGTTPYTHIPFQWSVHRLQHTHAPLEHFEFLAVNRSDPRLSFLQSLCAAAKDANCIVVYGSFEMTRLQELADRFPQYRGEVARACAKLWDLLGVLRRTIYHPAFGGSYSLKRVLPALVPELSYRGLEVANGNEAGIAWLGMLDATVGSDERDRLRKSLLAYCRRDTFALVSVLDVIKAYESPSAKGLRLVRRRAPAKQ